MTELQETIRKTQRKLELLECKDKLESEINLINAELKQLRIVAHNEQADVDNLESGGIKQLFLRISGKKEERLEQEKAEARTAQQNYEFAKARYELILNELDKCSTELTLLGSCDEVLRQMLTFPEDALLTALTHCVLELPRLRECIDTLLDDLSKVSRLAAFRSGTQSTSGLAGTDDRLIVAERKTQSALTQAKTDLQNFQRIIHPFGIAVNIDDIQKIADDYLTDLYTYALISKRVEKVSVYLRQIGFQLDGIKPQILQIQKDQHKNYLRSLLDAATTV